MECTVCERDLDAKRTALCTGCARTALYGARIQQAAALLSREQQHTQAEAIVRPGNDGVLAALPADVDLDLVSSRVRKYAVRRLKEERSVIDERIARITEKAKELQEQVDAYRQHTTRRRELQSRRRSDIAAEGQELKKQKSRLLNPLEMAISKAKQRLQKLHSRTTDARAFLCYEAARLSGLERRRGKDGKTRYWLGGTPLLDLRDLQGKDLPSTLPDGEDQDLVQSHEILSASMDNVCRLLGNCCHYLSIRLPAEILLPHDDFPHAMIVPLHSAYRIGDPQYPKSSTSSSPSPSASLLSDRQGRKSPPKPRPLQLSIPLSQLSSRDPKAFASLIEGLALLAYNIAWLSRSQGLDTVASFDDACQIGRNLHRLFLQDHSQRPSVERRTSSQQRKDDVKADRSRSVRIGAYSHGSTQVSLAGHQGHALFGSWRMPPPSVLADKLAAYLVNEMTGQEWDVLSEREWDEEREDEMAVLVGGGRGGRKSLEDKQRALAGAMSVMTVTSQMGAGEEEGKKVGKGNSGWMKVRGRNGDGG